MIDSTSGSYAAANIRDFVADLNWTEGRVIVYLMPAKWNGNVYSEVAVADAAIDAAEIVSRSIDTTALAGGWMNYRLDAADTEFIVPIGQKWESDHCIVFCDGRMITLNHFGGVNTVWSKEIKLNPIEKVLSFISPKSIPEAKPARFTIVWNREGIMNMDVPPNIDVDTLCRL